MVHIGDTQLLITYNLILILRDLRLPDKDRIPWNDATCTNQQDNVERGQQVQQMGEIYRGAAKVLFCIGRPCELTDFFVECLRGFWDAVRQDPDADRTSDSSAERFTSTEELIKSKWDDYLMTLEEEHHMLRKRLCKALKTITAEPWFERI